MDHESKQLLRMLISVLARGSFPEDRLRKIVIPSKSPDKYLAAYNLCDGKHSRTEIREEVGLDKANLNKVIDRWIKTGIIFEIEEGNQVKLLHLYPLAPDAATKLREKSSSRVVSERDEIVDETTEITSDAAG